MKESIVGQNDCEISISDWWAVLAIHITNQSQKIVLNRRRNIGKLLPIEIQDYWIHQRRANKAEFMGSESNQNMDLILLMLMRFHLQSEFTWKIRN